MATAACVSDLVRSATSRVVLVVNFVDDRAYLLGASLKDIGTGLCAVTEMTISPEEILKLMK